MPSDIRLQRIAERFQKEISELLIYEISDPRLSGVSVTDVTIDRELTVADIYVSALEGSSRSAEILEGFDRAKGFIRRQLAKRIDIRTMPRLRFHWDPTPENADRIERILAEIRQEREEKAE